MSGDSGTRAAILPLVALVTGCVGNPAPAGWLAPATEMQADPYGAWIVVETRGRTSQQGEFLAVDRDTVYLLVSDGQVQAFPVYGIHRARIAYYDSQWGGLAAWTGLGALSTLSNGWFAGLTFPLWVIAGPITTGGQSRNPIETVERGESWTDVRRYARYPQGVPDEMPRRMDPKPERFRPRQP